MPLSSSSSPQQRRLPNEPIVLAPLSKPAIVLLHGFRGSPLGLEKIAAELRAADYPVFTPAVPPFGGAKPLQNYSPESYTQFLIDYIEAENILRPILIGHSMGSIIAAAAAYRRPDLFCDQLVLMSPISTRTRKPIAMLAPLSAKFSTRTVDYATTQFLATNLRPKTFRRTLDLTHACSSDQAPKKKDVAAVAQFAASYSVADFPPTQRTLLLAGEHDRLIPKQKTIQLANQFAAETHFIPKTGHLHNYEKPHETAQAIIKFLEQ